MKLNFTSAFGLLCCASLHSPSFAEEEPTCEEILANETFRDALTRNDGRDFPVYAHDKEGHQLIGLECEKRVLDEHFLQGGWEIAGHKRLPKDGPFGPIGPPGDQHFLDTAFGYTICCEKPFWQIWAKRCSKSIVFHTYEGMITHISAGGNK